MSSKAGSTFVTFLMSIPVAAAGLMAIFGVPPLSSVIAASRGLNEKFQELSSEERGSRKPEESEFEEWDSGSAPSWKDDTDKGRTEVDDVTSPDRRKSEGDNDRDELGFSRIDDQGRNTADFNSRERHPLDESKGKTEPVSLDRHPFKKEAEAVNHSDDHAASRRVPMKESLKKLNTLGVKHYHLERGADQDTWLFVCLFSPGDDTRVTHRFESESADPEVAVSETLNQIDSWLLKRFRDKQPISQSAL